MICGELLFSHGRYFATCTQKHGTEHSHTNLTPIEAVMSGKAMIEPVQHASFRLAAYYLRYADLLDLSNTLTEAMMGMDDFQRAEVQPLFDIVEDVLAVWGGSR